MVADISLLEKELKFYKKHKSELLKDNRGKYVLIKDSDIIQIFESQKDAIETGINKFGNEPFLVKKIEEFEETQNFTSNLIECTGECHQ